MKWSLNRWLLFVLVMFLLSGCIPVNEALNGSSRQRTSQQRNKKPSSNTSNNSNSNKPTSNNNPTSSADNNSNSSQTNNANNSIYQQSKDYLKKRNTKLADYCVSWVGTPHVLGGNSRKGVDCSGFVYNVYKEVFDIVLPRRSADMEKEVDLYDSKSKMKEGDLVFFGKSNVNHVGIFLEGDKFIHTSTSKGVIVSSLEEKYWKANFKSCGHHPKMK